MYKGENIMKNKSIKLSLGLSVLFLLLTIASVTHFLFKSIFFGAGAALLLAGVILALAKKQHKSFWLPCVIMLLAYIMVFSFQFQTRTLDSFMPDGYTIQDIESIEISPMGTAGAITWQPGSGMISYSDGSSQLAVEGTNDVLQQMKNIPLRNYWYPGAVGSNTVFDMSIEFSDDNGRTAVSLYRGSNNEIAIYSRSSGDLSVSRWMTFGDIASVLPQEILSEIE